MADEATKRSHSQTFRKIAGGRSELCCHSPLCFLAFALGSQFAGAVSSAAGLASVVDSNNRSNQHSNTSKTIGADELMLIRDIESIAVSPDGKYVAYQLRQANPTTNDYDIRWYVATTGNEGDPWKLGDAGDVKLMRNSIGAVNGSPVATSEAKWSPDSKWIAYLRSENGESQLWKSRWDGESQTRLTNLPADIREFEWSIDGNSLVVKLNQRTRDEIESVRNAEALSGFHLDERFLPIRSTAPIFPDEKEFEIWVLDASTHRIRKAAPEEVLAYDKNSTLRSHLDFMNARLIQDELSAGLVGFAIAANDIINSVNPPLQLYASITGQADEIKACESPLCFGYIRSIWRSRDGGEIIFYKNEGVNFQGDGYYAWNPSSDVVRQIYFDPNVLVRDCAIGNIELFCRRESATETPQIVAINIESGSKRTVSSPNSSFDEYVLGKVQRVEWPNSAISDDYPDTGYGYLVYPPNYDASQSYPLVVVQYVARGFLRGAVGDEYPIHALSAAGFVVFVFDRPRPWRLLARIADDDELARLLQENNHQDRRVVLASLTQGLEEVIAHANIDYSRVGISGLSDGANTTFYGLMFSKRFAVAVTSSGPWDPVSFYLSNRRIRNSISKWGLGDPRNEGEELWATLAPSWNAEMIDAPLLINVADRELNSAMPTITMLQELNRPVDAYVYPNEYHIKWQPHHRLAIYRRNLQWFRFWLLNEQVQDPIDPEQYTRWRKMRAERCAWDEEVKPGYCKYEH